MLIKKHMSIKIIDILMKIIIFYVKIKFLMKTKTNKLCRYEKKQKNCNSGEVD